MYPFDEINIITERMISCHQTVAVAESVTSGHLQAALSLGQNARQFYQGGLTAYNLGQKSRHLLVEPIHAFAVAPGPVWTPLIVSTFDEEK